jgi:arylsulfatase
MSARGEVRHQYAHAIDMVPTVLEAIGIPAPASVRGVRQTPIEGVSFAHTFDVVDAPGRHAVQYFEMFGERAIDYDGWRAVCAWPGPSFTEAATAGHTFADPITRRDLEELEASGWELYHVAEDPTEAVNVAAENPAKLAELVTMWWVEAGKYKVLPLDGSVQQRLTAERPQVARPRKQFVYYAGGAVVPPFAAPPIFNRPYSIEADLEVPAEGVEGVLLAQGGDAGGYTFYVLDGVPRFSYNYVGRDRFEVVAPDPLAPGKHTVRFEFQPTGEPDIRKGLGVPGRADLYVDGVVVAAADFPHTTPLFFEVEGLSCGYDFGAPAAEYVPPFTFTGTLHQVTVDLSGELIVDDEATMARLLAQQ